jgi:hypothetical protein
MNAIRPFETRTLNGLKDVRASQVRKLKELTNISWLTRHRLDKLVGGLSVIRVELRGQIFDESDCSDRVYVLISGVARITCRNSKGRRAVVTMSAPGIIPVFPQPVVGINYNFRCEAVTNCQVGTLGWNEYIEICLGIPSAEFERMVANYVGRWDLAQLRCSNFMSCTLAERMALILFEFERQFWGSRCRGSTLDNSGVAEGCGEIGGHLTAAGQ